MKSKLVAESGGERTFVLGLSDGLTRGGHLIEGSVQPTLEVTLIETPAHLRRKKRPELGLALIDLAEA
jgi:uncharacterized protein